MYRSSMRASAKSASSRYARAVGPDTYRVAPAALQSATSRSVFAPSASYSDDHVSRVRIRRMSQTASRNLDSLC